MRLKISALAVVALAAVLARPAPATLLVRYTFDEAASGTTDALNIGGSVAGANGQFHGSSTRTTDTPNNFSPAAMAVNPNGGPPYDYVGPSGDLAGLDKLSALTVTMWLKVQAPTVNVFHPLVADIIGGASSAGWMLYYTHDAGDTAQTLGVEVDGITASADTVVHATGVWVFVAATWNGTNVTFYTGSPTSAASQLGVSQSLLLSNTTDNAVAMRVGSYTDGSTGPDALIDDVRVYDSVLDLSALDVVRLQDLQIPEPSSLLLLLVGGVVWSRFRPSKRG